MGSNQWPLLKFYKTPHGILPSSQDEPYKTNFISSYLVALYCGHFSFTNLVNDKICKGKISTFSQKHSWYTLGTSDVTFPPQNLQHNSMSGMCRA